MKQKILIICLLLESCNCKDNYILSFDMLISGSSKYEITLINKKSRISDEDIFYFGTVEYMENIIINSYNKREKLELIRKENHPLVLMLENCLSEYINYFSTDTKFIIDQKCINNNNNYSDYTIFSVGQQLAYYIYMVKGESFYYVKIGKDIESSTKIFFYIMIGVTTITSVFLCFIMKRVLRNMDETNILLINFLISHISDLLFMAVIGNCLSFFFFMGKESLDFLSEYILVFLVSLYKGGFYASAIFLLQGWMTTTFISIGDNFKKYYKRLLLYELLLSLLLHISVYFFNFTSKLNFLYFFLHLLYY